MGGIIGGIGSLVGLGSSIANAVGGSGSGPQGNVPAQYQVLQPGRQNMNLLDLQNQLYGTAKNLPQQLLPGYQAASQNITNNPYAMLQQQGANQAGAMGPAVSGMQMGGANSLYSAGNQIMGTAFDPQQALYQRTLQQITDQMRAANSASGVYGPAAAGVEQQGLTNFNIDWQNNLLKRQMEGITGGGRAYTDASYLASLAPQSLSSISGMPYRTYLGGQQDILGGLDALSHGATSAYALPQMTMSDLQSYLRLEQASCANALAAQRAQFDQTQQQGKNLAGSLAGLSSNYPSMVSSLNSLFTPTPTGLPQLYDPYGNITGNADTFFGIGGGGY